MPDLDQSRQFPSCWIPEMVQGRLVDAFNVEYRMPKEHFAKTVSSTSWPVAPMYEFQDVLHWEDARERVWDNWRRAKGVYPYEITKMEEALDWLLWVPIGERRCLHIWAQATAKRLRIRKILRMHGWPRSTFYRAVDKGAARISDRLNAEGVQIR